MIMGCGQWCMCYIWQQIEYYNYYVKVSSISKFICYCNTHEFLYMYVIIVHVMSCVFMLDVVCVDYCTRYLLLLYDIISIACTL